MSVNSPQVGMGHVVASYKADAGNVIAQFMRRIRREQGSRRAQPTNTHSTRSCGAEATCPPPSPQATASVVRARAALFESRNHSPPSSELAPPASNISVSRSSSLLVTPKARGPAQASPAGSSSPMAQRALTISGVAADKYVRSSFSSGSATTTARALVANRLAVPPPLPSSGSEPGPSSHQSFSGPSGSAAIDTPATAANAPVAMDVKHPLVSRLIASLRATTPRDGLALPNAQLVARRALANGSRRPRCWTTTLFPPRIAHNAACEASHLTLVPMPSSSSASAAGTGDKGAGNRGAKGKFKAKAKGKDRDRVRLPRGQFAMERDVALGWALPQPVDVNAMLGLSGGGDALDEAEAERVFVLAALALAHDFDHSAHLTLWGSTTAVMTSKRIQRFLDGAPALPVKLPIVWLGVTNMLWFIQGQHVQRFAADMPYLNAASLADAEAEASSSSSSSPLPTATAPSTRVTRNAARPAAPVVSDTSTPPADAPPRRPPAATHWEDAPTLDTPAFPDWVYTAKEVRVDLEAHMETLRRLVPRAAAAVDTAADADADTSPLSQCSSLPSSLSSLSSSSSTPPAMSEAESSLSGETFVTFGSEAAISRGTSVDTCVSDASFPATSKASGGARRSREKRKRIDEAEDVQEVVSSKRARRATAPGSTNAGSRPARRMPARRAAGRS